MLLLNSMKSLLGVNPDLNNEQLKPDTEIHQNIKKTGAVAVAGNEITQPQSGENVVLTAPSMLEAMST